MRKRCLPPVTYGNEGRRPLLEFVLPEPLQGADVFNPLSHGGIPADHAPEKKF